MAEPTAVNGQITDAVTQANISVLGNAPATAMSMVSQAAAHALALSMQNAVSHQQHMNQIAAASLELFNARVFTAGS